MKLLGFDCGFYCMEFEFGFIFHFLQTTPIPKKKKNDTSTIDMSLRRGSINRQTYFGTQQGNALLNNENNGAMRRIASFDTTISLRYLCQSHSFQMNQIMYLIQILCVIFFRLNINTKNFNSTLKLLCLNYMICKFVYVKLMNVKYSYNTRQFYIKIGAALSFFFSIQR